MNISNNGFITINRGDSFSAPLFINCGTQLMPIRYSLKDHPRTEVYLGVMEPNQTFENAIIRKKYDINSKINQYGDLIIDLSSSDTEYLLPGKYYYLVRAKIYDRYNEVKVVTLVQRRNFIIND